MHINNEFLKKEIDIKQKESHNKLFDIIFKDIISKKGFNFAKKIKDNYHILKKSRNNADYKSKDFKSGECIYLKKTSNNLKNDLISIYNLK